MGHGKVCFYVPRNDLVDLVEERLTVEDRGDRVRGKKVLEYTR